MAKGKGGRELLFSDSDTTIIRNVGKFPPTNMASYPGNTLNVFSAFLGYAIPTKHIEDGAFKLLKCPFPGFKQLQSTFVLFFFNL